MLEIRGKADQKQLERMLKRHDDIVAVEPCPIGKKGKINPHATRYYHADGRITSVFIGAPLYYQTRWGTWESIRDIVTKHSGNHRIIFDPKHIWKVHPNYIQWLENRQKLLKNAYVAVDSPFGVPALDIAKATNISMGMAVTTVNPDAGTGSTTVDGHIDKNNGTSWDNAHDATDGTSTSDADPTFFLRNRKSGSTFLLGRGYLTFDTSSIPDGDTVSAGTITIEHTGQLAATNTDADEYIAYCDVVGLGADNDLANSDFDACTVDSPTEYTDHVSLLDITADGDTSVNTLNATGLSSISLTGVSRFCLRIGLDIDDIEPVGHTSFTSYAADTSTKEPELSVTHAAAATAPPRTRYSPVY